MNVTLTSEELGRFVDKSWLALREAQQNTGPNNWIEDDPVKIVEQGFDENQLNEEDEKELSRACVGLLIKQFYIFPNKSLNGKPIEKFKVRNTNIKPNNWFTECLERLIAVPAKDFTDPHKPKQHIQQERVPLQILKESPVEPPPETKSCARNDGETEVSRPPISNGTVAIWVDLPNYAIRCRDIGIRAPIKGLLEKARSFGKIVIANAYHDFNYDRHLLLQFQNNGFRLITCINQKDRGYNESDAADEIMLEDIIESRNKAGIHIIVSFDRRFRRQAGRLKLKGKKVYRVYTDSTRKIVAIDDFPIIDSIVPSFYDIIPLK